MLTTLPKKMFSPEGGKAAKAAAYGYRNCILYLAPFDFAGVGNLCPHASPACRAACLGLYSGQASMVLSDAPEHANNVRKARILKAQHFMRNRASFMAALADDIARNIKAAKRDGLQLCVRLNGSSDIAFEAVAITLSELDAARLCKLSGNQHGFAAGVYRSIYAVFSGVQFIDYTKTAKRMAAPRAPNYHLTFSRSETNEATALDMLKNGHNVAVVFDVLPDVWHGHAAVSGDNHDLRHLDPRGGYVIGLTPKGQKAKRDTSGFVVRAA